MCCARPPGGASGGRGLRFALCARLCPSAPCAAAALLRVLWAGTGCSALRCLGSWRRAVRCAAVLLCAVLAERSCLSSSPSVRSALGNASPWGPVRLPGFAYCKTVGPASLGGKVRSPPPCGSAAAGAWHGSARLWEGWGYCSSRWHLCIEAGRDR